MMLSRFYRRLLLLYPAESRRAWGPGMQTTFELRARELSRAGLLRRGRFVSKEIVAVLTTAFAERFSSASRRRRTASRGQGAGGSTNLRSPRSPRRDIVSNSLFDLRIAARGWRREPLATAVIVLTLALGIGATTAIFTVVDGVLLRPLPFPAASRLVRVNETLADGDTWTLSMPDFVDIRAQASGLDAVAVIDTASLTLSGEGDPERIAGMEVSAGLFGMLGMPMTLGRSFDPADEAEGSPDVVILGYDFWRTRYDADPDVLGRTIRLEGRAHTIIGVAPPGVDLGSGEPRVWIPFRVTEGGLENRGGHMYPVLARLAEDSSLDAASDEVAGIMGRIAAEHPNSHEGRSAMLEPLRDDIVGDVDQTLFVLLAAVGMLLLIACTNVASIMLARSDARGQEVALRAALGASAGRLVRQLLAESVALTLIGGGAGVLLAHLGVRAIIDSGAADLPRATAVHTDWRVMAFALLVSCATGVGVGLAPALRAVRGDLYAPIKSAARGQTGAGRFGLHRALVVTEMALAVMLVLGAGLLLQSLVRLQGVDKGFDTEGVLSFRVGLPTSRYPTQETWAGFATRLRQELSQQPGVDAVGGIGLLPFFASQTTDLQIAGDEEAVVERVQFRHTTPGFLEAMGTDVIRGRSFTDRDVAGATPVMILNETAARRLFGNEDPVGRYVTTGWGSHPDEIQVVGVVEDVRFTGLQNAAPPAMYWPLGQYDARNVMYYVVRTSGDPTALIPTVRQAVTRLDAELPIYGVELLDQRLKRSVARERMTTGLLSGFAVLALLLAAVGIFGVMAYAVVRRRREIGVRVAIGASPGEVVAGILREGLLLTLGGVGIGVVGGLALGRAFSSVLFETNPADPITYAGVSLLLVTVALLATLLPALRAARVDPMVVLRNE